jgi:hypothetical protein
MNSLDGVHVFQICECDAVAAHSVEEARVWYKNLTGQDDDELYTDEDVELIDPDYSVWTDENKTGRETVGKIVTENWKGKPFIVFSTMS